MKKFEKFLFFYSIIASTIFFISFGLTSPTPLNFISGVLFLPVIFYFWIRLTSPQSVNADKWSLRFLVSIAILSSLGIFAYYLNSLKNPSSEITALKNMLSEAQIKNEEISFKLADSLAKLEEVKNEKNSPSPAVSGESIADLIYETPQGASTQRIKAKEGVSVIDVYQSPDPASKKIAGLESGVKYPYIEKDGSWYKVVVTSTTSGWVNSTQVQEVY